MRWLNYHHLYYFYRVARAGSIVAAAKELRVTHSTLSVQIKELGEALGGPLFEKRGRRLVLTPLGEHVLAYAEDIFHLGAELLESTSQVAGGALRTPLRIGLVPTLPRSLAYRLLEPALAVSPPPLVLRGDGYPKLLEDLSLGRVHGILAEAPPPAPSKARHYVHPLGRSKLAFYGAPHLARAIRGGFPRSLATAPLVLPASTTPLRRALDRWFAQHRIQPRVVVESDDAAAVRTLGAHGHGVFPVRLALRAEVEDYLGAEFVGPIDGIEETYFLVSVERRVRHPFLASLVENARDALDT
jgi:LysR family transcriptional activator of nhaA